MKTVNLLHAGVAVLVLTTCLSISSNVAFAETRSNFDTVRDYIIGGQTVSAGDIIAATTVMVTDGNFICTGSIIAQDIVVTAAHCTAAQAENLRIVFSRQMPSDLTTVTDTVHDIYGFVANPGWQGEQSTGPDQHDIAVIRFKGNLPSGYSVATLLSKSTALTKGETVTLAGYGITDAASQAGAGLLRKVDVQVLKKLGETEEVLDQSEGAGACHGDSGGPAFVTVNGKLLLWGVTNRGYPDNAPDDCVHESVYTRITAYTEFVNSAAEQLRNQQ
jgi:secreted trypsin-like serine protease